MNQPKFSVVSVGRNEQSTLPRLLESLREFLSRGGEFIYVDTGSTDNSVSVARDGGAVVFDVGDRFRYVCDADTASAINEKFVVVGEPDIIKDGDSFFAFDKARNYAMTLAKNDFICTPDCDEAWTTLNIDKINNLIDDGYEKLMVDFVFAHFPDGTPSVEFCADTRFYDRRRISWKGIIHETMRHDGELKMCRVGRDVAYLEHFQNQETDRAKYLSGLAWACYQQPGNDRNSHYFARELMYKGYYRSAIKEFKRHIDMNAWDEERGQSMVFMANCYDALGMANEALKWWNLAFELTGNRREPLLSLAYYWKGKDKKYMVSAYAAASLEIPNNGFYANRVSNYTFEPHALLYWAKGWTGDIFGARNHWMKCYDYHPNDPVFKRDFDYYFSKPMVSIVIPSIRPDRLKVCLEHIKNNSGYDNYEIIVENDDPDNPTGATKLVKSGVEKSKGELVMFLGDDTIPEDNFLYHAVVAMHRHYPDLDGLIGLNDMLWRGEIATHWLASKKLLPYLDGEFFHTGYYHVGCDSELTERCKKIGKYAWAENAKILHDHPSRHGWSDETYDKHYRRVYDADVMRRDRDLLFKRAKDIGFRVSFGNGCLGDYPEVHPALDLRKRILPIGMKVLNVGIGTGQSWLAKQLHHLEFKSITNIDVHKPYVDKAREFPWASLETRFAVMDVRDIVDFSEYDMVFMFDVIEHLPKDDGAKLLKMPFKKLVFIPIETEPRNNPTDVESQEHVSFWTEQELKDLGHKTEVVKQYMKRTDGTMMDSVWAWN